MANKETPPRSIEEMAVRLMRLERKVASLETRVPDKKFIEEEFKFLREQAKLTNKALDILLAKAKLEEDRDDAVDEG